MLKRVEIVAKTGTENRSFSATVREGSRTGTSLGTLTNPTLTGSLANAQFTASGNGIALKATTTYVVVLAGTGANLDATTSDNEDTGAATGWSIANTNRIRGGTSAGASLRMEVWGYANNAPTVANAIPDRAALAGTAFSYAFPANTFADADTTHTLTYTAKKSDDSALPSWLTFTAGTRAFSGTPAAGDAGTLSVKVTASDGIASVSDTFDIVVKASNNAPTVANAIPDRKAAGGTAFSYAFPANTFNDADGDTLTYTATKSDDSALPSWLTFTAGTRTFSGTPAAGDAGTLSVKVTASDGIASVSDTFDIVVKASNAAPTVANAIPNQLAVVGTAFSYTFPANTFNDADGDTLIYTVFRRDPGTGTFNLLPGWLTFTASTRTFSGTPAAGDAGNVEVVVGVSDGIAETGDTFDVVVVGPPTVSGVAISSTPSLDTDDSGTPETYGLTEVIRVKLTFSEAVTVTGTPRLKIKMDPNFGEFWANYETGSGSTELFFAYTVVEPNKSPNGIAVLENTLELNGGTIRAGTANATLAHAGLAHDAGHKVDWEVAGTPEPPPRPPQPPQPRDTTPPRVSAAPTVDGATLTIVFNERLARGAIPPAAFEVVVGGGGVTPSAVEVDHAGTGRTVTLTLPAPVAHGETVEVRYTRPAASGERLRDVAGNAVADFTRTVTNETPAPPPGSPVADAGADLAVDPDASVTLDGSASADPDGDALSYAWTQTSGAAVALEGADTARATFTAPAEPGALAFRLTVTDPGGLSALDDVTVTVRDVGPRFAAPAPAPALTLVLDREMEPVVLPAATGGNGGPHTYALTSAPAGLAGLSFDAETRTLSGTPAAEGRWTFTWTAHDGDSNTAPSDAARVTFRVTVAATAPEVQRRAVKRTVAALAAHTLASALDTIGARLSGALPGANLTLAGESVPLFSPSGGSGAAAGWRAGPDLGPCPVDGFGNGFRHAGFGAARGGCAPAGRSRTLGTAELLGASAFSLTLGAAPSGSTGRDARRLDAGDAAPAVTRIRDAGEQVWSLWGRGDLGAFAGRPEPGMRYEGETRTGWLGVDARAGRWIAGLAVSHGTGESDYSFAGGDDPAERGRLETAVSALWPYARWTFGNGLELRGMAGAGTGTLRHAPGGGAPAEESGLTMWAGSVGIKQNLPRVVGIDLAARGDASFARIASAGGGETLNGLLADSLRVRGGVEASRRFALGGERALVPFLELAARQDDGDGVTGTGLELAGGLRFAAPRVDVELRGRWLAAHTREGTEERGLSVNARIGPGAHGLGLSLMLSPRWGAGTGGAQALWRDELPTAAGAPHGDAGALDARIGYGVGVAPHGLLTPFAETRLAGDHWRLRLGTRFEAAHVNLGVELAGEHREGGAAGPEQVLKLDLKLRQ